MTKSYSSFSTSSDDSFHSMDNMYMVPSELDMAVYSSSLESSYFSPPPFDTYNDFDLAPPTSSPPALYPPTDLYPPLNAAPQSFTSVPGVHGAPGPWMQGASQPPLNADLDMDMDMDMELDLNMNMGMNTNILEPELVPIDSSSSSPEATTSSAKNPSKPFSCPKCQRAFTRPADLKRHQSSVHDPVFQDCPVAGCLRKAENGFPRRDHLTEHLRSYHHWDVPKRRSAAGAGGGGGARRVR